MVLPRSQAGDSLNSCGVFAVVFFDCVKYFTQVTSPNTPRLARFDPEHLACLADLQQWSFRLRYYSVSVKFGAALNAFCICRLMSCISGLATLYGSSETASSIINICSLVNSRDIFFILSPNQSVRFKVVNQCFQMLRNLLYCRG